MINIITRRARDYPGLHLGLEGSLPAASHAFLGYGLPLEQGGREGGLTVGLDHLRSWGPRQRNGASLTAARSWIPDGGGPLPAAGAPFGNAHVSYGPAPSLPTAALALRGVSSRPVSGTAYPRALGPPPPAARGAAGRVRAHRRGPRLPAGGRPVAHRPLPLRGRTDAGSGNGLGYQAVLPVPTYRVMLGLRYGR
ncbi:MAG TPA: hypothetical protein VMU15_14755 [Anaeromyxobacter sp.]|nr:hypothetical protein [Anaeromyxobacter sp.]